MSKKSRNDAREVISTWSTDNVLCLLQKNGLEECCTAVAKRQIDGDELLHLTEGKLALWKSDLTRLLIRRLSALVEEIQKCPENFIEIKSVGIEEDEDQMSDTGSWATDFEDEVADDHTTFEDTRNMNVSQINSNYIHDHAISKKIMNANTDVHIDGNEEEQVEETYVNCDMSLEKGKMYTNYNDNVPNVKLPKNVSRLHGTGEKNIAEKLKEQLELRNAKKPALGPKPTDIIAKRNENLSISQRQPQKSFLHTEVKTRPISNIQRRMAVPPPPTPPKLNIDPTFAVGKIDKDITKASNSIRNLDLVANLPTRTDDSEGEYEQFDEQIIEHNHKSTIPRIDSKQSLASGTQSSVESVYQPPSTTSCEDEEEPCDIYECITESPEDNGYLSPIQRVRNSPLVLPPLPFKLPQTPSPTPTLNRLQMPNSTNERSPDKKSATLPHSGSNSSLLSERATRPLPPPPDRLSYVDKPWFHNVTREEAKTLIRERTFGVPPDGYFLLRPSMTNVNNPLALVLWRRDRFYNIPVRKRPDNRYALGSAKVNERSFSSVEEMVTYYTNNGLVLDTGEVTKLTETPSK